MALVFLLLVRLHEDLAALAFVGVESTRLFVENPQEQLLEEGLDLRLQGGVVFLGVFQQVLLDARALFFLDLLSSELSAGEVGVGGVIRLYLAERTVLAVIGGSHCGLPSQELATTVVNLCQVTQFVAVVKFLFIKLCQN